MEPVLHDAGVALVLKPDRVFRFVQLPFDLQSPHRVLLHFPIHLLLVVIETGVEVVDVPIQFLLLSGPSFPLFLPDLIERVNENIFAFSSAPLCSSP